jgi:hypothetical protein
VVSFGRYVCLIASLACTLRAPPRPRWSAPDTWAEGLGWPRSCIRSPPDADEMRQARARRTPVAPEIPTQPPSTNRSVRLLETRSASSPTRPRATRAALAVAHQALKAAAALPRRTGRPRSAPPRPCRSAPSAKRGRLAWRLRSNTSVSRNSVSSNRRLVAACGLLRKVSGCWFRYDYFLDGFSSPPVHIGASAPARGGGTGASCFTRLLR